MNSQVASKGRPFILFSMFVALAALAQTAQAARECSLQRVAGQYGYTSGGTVVTPAVGPFTAVGTVVFTSNGTFSGAQTTSVAGNLFSETVNGTFEVNRDCTGAATVYVYRGATLVRTSLIALVWDDNAREIRSIFKTGGTAITILGRKTFGDDGEDD